MSDVQNRIDTEPAKAFLRRHPDITGRFIIKGKLMRLDQRTRRGRIYPWEVIQRELERYRQKLPQLGGSVYLGGREEEDKGVNNSAFLVHDVALEEGGNVQIKAEIIHTPAGKALEKMWEQGEVTFGPRGIGRLTADGTVVDDYQLESIDAIPKYDH